ncbi:MAG TPA: hypothetical protein PKL13_02120 [bacterium]|nr:hypothetical protein [bacterium]
MKNNKNKKKPMTWEEVNKALMEPAEDPEESDMEEAIITIRLPKETNYKNKTD